jgi:hypothetical protein
MKKIVHVNQHIIKENRKNGTRKPPLTCKTSKDNIYAKDIIIDGPCRIRYNPDKPLSCGAHVEEVLNELLEKHPHAYLPWIEEVAERVTLKRLEEME